MRFMLQTLIPTLMTLCRMVELTQKRIEAGLVEDPFVAMNAALDALELVTNEVDADLWNDVRHAVLEEAQCLEEQIAGKWDYGRAEDAMRLHEVYDATYGGTARTRTQVDRFLGALAEKHGEIVAVDIFSHHKDNSPLTATLGERLH